MVALLVVARIVEGPIAALWRKYGPFDNEASFTKNLKRYVYHTSSTIEAHTNDSVHEEGLSLPSVLNDVHPVASGDAERMKEAMIEGRLVPLFADHKMSVLDGTPGISLAAAIDPDGNRQLFDLTSTGIIRLRKSVKGGTSWTDPEIVPANPKPKLNSPLAAISRPRTNGA
ncbi:MAG: hypothetical protein LQ346_005355 [Caloplaca aetnensis]|nr:MAG: hypothetical protein LQ346_005355 [Caloplaca aetnensis]